MLSRIIPLMSSQTSIQPRVFIVENHEDTLRYLVKFMQSQGWEVRSAQSVGDALAALEGWDPKVLISDLGLPDGNGWELMEQLRERGQHPFAIAMSGFGMFSDIQRSKRAGYTHHLTKPFMPEDLEKALREVA